MRERESVCVIWSVCECGSVREREIERERRESVCKGEREKEKVAKMGNASGNEQTNRPKKKQR